VDEEVEVGRIWAWSGIMPLKLMEVKSSARSSSGSHCPPRKTHTILIGVQVGGGRWVVVGGWCKDVGGGRWAVDDGWPGVGGKVRHKRRTNRKCPSKSTKNKEMLHNESIKLESPCPAPHRHF